jgi:hypothetical protein
MGEKRGEGGGVTEVLAVTQARFEVLGNLLNPNDSQSAEKNLR